ncbi:MAG: ribosome-binding factor A [Flavobacteriaceae bacterium]|nr:MAG: ribosome-binding factor A [Flavobacteriaceae bacterium]
MSTTRQEKVANLLQQEFAKIFQKQSKDLLKGILITVTEVRVTVDFSIAKIYLSIFPTDHGEAIFKEIQAQKSDYRKKLGLQLKNQLRIIPDLIFYLDETFEKMDKIQQDLDGKAHNPIA